MAYGESTLGGSTGGSYRVWVNSIRTRDGDAADNSEDWRVEGGLNKIGTGVSAYNNYNAATYTLQLGMNGVASSGHFNYNFASSTTGRVLAWGTGATRVSRNSAGVGFGFQSRMDINMSNSPLLTSGWVTSNDALITRYRHATLTALSMDAGGIPWTDEGPGWLEFSNPSGAAVDAFLEAPGPGFPRIFTSAAGIGSRYNFVFPSTITASLQAAIPNSNTGTLRIGIHDSLGGDNWDFRDRDFSIKNDVGQANPTFSNFTYLDTDTNGYGTVAITGSNQVLIQNKSTLQATISTGNKATANKAATMDSYLFSIGEYSQSSTWSNTTSVVKDIGVISDVSGSQALTVRAIDSRSNGTTVTKNVTVLPYESPGFFQNLDVKYTNDFDNVDGLTVNLLNGTTIAAISPMTLSGTDKNAVTPTTGIRFDMAKDVGSFTGTWTNVAFTQAAGTGLVTTNAATLATQIQTKMNAMGANNTVRWYILFQIQDKLETQYFTVAIDVGRPFFRIGADGRLYYKEIEFFETFSGKSDLYYPSLQAYAVTGTFGKTGVTNFVGGWCLFYNTSGANGDKWGMDVYIPAGVYKFIFYFYGSTQSAKIDVTANGTTLITQYDTYNATVADKAVSSNNIGVLDGATYTILGTANGRNASNTTGYINGLLGIQIQRTGNI